MTKHPQKPQPAEGPLLILLPGLGAVSSTFVAGVELARKGKALPVGSLTQMGTVRLGKRTEKRIVPIKELVPLASLDDIRFAAWDIVPDNARQVVERAGVLSREHENGAAEVLEGLEPMPGVHDSNVVARLNATHFKEGMTKREQADALRQDIRDAKKRVGAERAVTLFLASTERRQIATEVHQDLASFEKAIDENDAAITPTMLYAYASLMEDAPFANGTPNLSVDLPALRELAIARKVPIAGKDLKTGQTMVKTVMAPALKARMLGLNGWFSTNILGNRDGEVLDDEQAFKSKETTKAESLGQILQPDLYPDLYGNTYHKVRINYYPPRGDAKEGWDNIDLFGWLGYPMQMKIDFLCRDSILAAPLALDLALFMDLARRLGWGGIQEWLSFYFKAPMAKSELYPEHDLFIQQTKLKNTLRYIAGEDLITHLGLEYYEDDTSAGEK